MKRILVVGLGGIGGVLSANWRKHNIPLVAVSKNQQIIESITQHGLSIKEKDKTYKYPITVLSQTPQPGEFEPFDYIFLTTRPTDVEEAANNARSVLSDNGYFIVLQNGLCEEIVEKIVGPERVIGCVVAWGASTLAPGLVQKTSSGGFTLGKMGSNQPIDKDLCKLLGLIAPIKITTNLQGVRWSKLAINCAISGLGAAGHNTLSHLLRYSFVRRLAFEIIHEVLEVAKAERIKLEPINGTVPLKYVACRPEERGLTTWFKHLLGLVVALKYRKLKSSMLRALERGRPTGVQFVNGEVCARAKRLGIKVPINDAIVQLLTDAHKGSKQTGLDALKTIFKRTRSSSAMVEY